MADKPTQRAAGWRYLCKWAVLSVLEIRPAAPTMLATGMTHECELPLLSDT